MGRISLYILIILLPANVFGQKVPLSNHYIYDALSINPAFAGSHNSLSTTLLYKNQWVGLDDSPRKQILSAHTPVFNDRIGLGLLIDRNEFGIFNETSFLANYAYRIEINNGILAMGLGLGVTLKEVLWQDLVAIDPDDQLLSYENRSYLMPEFSLGTYYYTRDYFVGISIPLFMSHKFDETRGKYVSRNDFSDYTYMIMGGYSLSIGSTAVLVPSMLVRYHAGSSVQIDFNAHITLMNKITLGASYRSWDKIVGMFSYRLNNQLKIAYSYDYEFGQLGKFLTSSHEIMLGYTLEFTRKVHNPR